MGDVTKVAINVAEPTLWGQYGLPGLVILTLFILLAATLWFGSRRIDDLTDKQMTAWNDLHEAHRKERDAWREESGERIERFTNALERLTDKIRDHRQ